MGTLTVDNLNVNSTATISSGVEKVLQVQYTHLRTDTEVQHLQVILIQR